MRVTMADISPADVEHPTAVSFNNALSSAATQPKTSGVAALTAPAPGIAADKQHIADLYNQLIEAETAATASDRPRNAALRGELGQDVGTAESNLRQAIETDLTKAVAGQTDPASLVPAQAASIKALIPAGAAPANQPTFSDLVDQASSDVQNQLTPAPQQGPVSVQAAKNQLSAFGGGINGGPYGVQTYLLQPGQTPWQVYGLSGMVNMQQPSQIQQEFAASPALDPKAFDSRPGNPPDATYGLPVGTPIYVLDQTRLGYLQQQRTTLAQIESDPQAQSALQQYTQLTSLAPQLRRDPDMQAAITQASDNLNKALDPLTQTIATELDYAAQMMPDPTSNLDALAAPIAARAPNNPYFNKALAAAEQQVTTEWAADGRTPDQLGKLQSDISKGDTSTLKADATSQFRTLALQALSQNGGDSGLTIQAVANQAGIDITYMDPASAAIVSQAAQDALQQTLVGDAVQRITAAGRTNSAAGIKQLQTEVSLTIDPTTNAPYKTSGQIAAILNDPQVQALMRRFVDQAYDSTGVQGYVEGDTGTVPPLSDADLSSGMNALGAVCQDALTSDSLAAGQSAIQPSGGQTGKSAVDAIANYIIKKPDGSNILGGSMESLVEAGNAALPVAIAAADVRAGQDPDGSDNPGETTVMSAIRFGLDNYKQNTLDPLKARMGKDDVALAAGQSEWGNLLTTDPTAADQKQVQAIQNKLMTPAVLQDIADQASAQLTLRSIQNVISLYPDVQKAPGYNTDISDLSLYPVTPSTNVSQALNSALSDVGLGGANNAADKVPFTPYWWLTRATVSGAAAAIQEMSHNAMRGGALSAKTQAFLNFLEGQPGATPDLAAPAPTFTEGALRRTVPFGMSALWALNSAHVLGTASQSSTTALKLDNIGFGLNQLYFSLTDLATFINPNWKTEVFGANADGNAATPLRAFKDMLTQGLDGADMPAPVKTSLQRIVGTVLGDTGDLSYGLLAAAGVVAMANAPGNNLPHEVAYGLAAVSVIPFLLKAGPQIAAGDTATTTATEAAGKLFLGMSVDDWTLVGFALNFVSAGIDFVASLHDAAHSLDPDKAWLEAQGVPDNIADPMARHATTLEGGVSAGQFVTAYFRHEGLTNDDMIAWMKSIPSGKEADLIATYAKNRNVSTDPKTGAYTMTDDQATMFKDFLAMTPDQQNLVLNPIRGK